MCNNPEAKDIVFFMIMLCLLGSVSHRNETWGVHPGFLLRNVELFVRMRPLCFMLLAISNQLWQLHVLKASEANLADEDPYLDRANSRPYSRNPVTHKKAIKVTTVSLTASSCCFF